jgi:alkylation response protein AidB-like acyl-CoA dehydrogenase
MDFTPTEAQQELARLTRTIVSADRPAWTELAAAGVLSAALPASAGGDGFGLLEQCAILVELGRAVAPVPYLPSIVAGAATVAQFGTSAQIERWAAPAGRGELILTAAPAASALRISRSENGWVLSGSLSPVPAGSSADLILVPTAEGVFLVQPKDVSIEDQQVAGGPGAAWVDLSDVELSAEQRLDDPDAAGWCLERTLVGLCAAQLGVLERALELTAAYAGTRVQFGRAIGTFQAVTQRLADAYIDVEAVRLTLWQAAWRLATGQPAAADVHTAKYWAAEAGHRVAHTAVHIHGGVGIDLEYPLHRYFLAAKYNELTLGGATEHLLQIGRSLAQL